MGFLSDLFNPDPANLFGGDKGDFVNNALDPVGGFLESNDWADPWGAGGLHEDVGDWMNDIGDTTEQLAKSRSRNVNQQQMSGNMFKRDALTGFTGFGGSPIGTRLSNKVLANEDRPLWDMYGGATRDDYQYAEDKGVDTTNQRGLDAVGQSVGKGFINAFTYGLGSTALDALNSYGYGDEATAKKQLESGAKNWALNWGLGSAMDTGSEYFGSKPGDVGNAGYGDYKSYYDSGGTNTTGGFNLGQQLGAGEYSPIVNAAAKGSVGNAASTAMNGGNSEEIGKAALTGAVQGAARPGIGMGMDYLRSMYNEDMPDVGTVGGTMQDQYGENSATLGGEVSPAQRDANDQRMYAMSIPEASPSVGDRVSTLLSSVMGDGSSGPSSNNFGNYTDLASTLFGVYNANKQRRRIKEQADSLSRLFSPDSPYAQQMRQRMERKDAAAGRRSQYGPRETQLAALLADKQASTMPQQMKYADALGGYDNMMVNAGIRGVGQLNNMFRNRPPVVPMRNNDMSYVNGGNALDMWSRYGVGGD